MIKVKDIYKLLTQLSKREKAIFYVAIAFLILTLLDRLILLPIFSKVNSLNSEIKEKTQGINRDLRILSQKDRILSEKEKYASFLSGHHSEDEDITVLLKEIENIANKSSIYLVDMKPAGTKEDKDKNKKYLVNVNCEALMEQIMGFMYSIENSSSLLSIEKYQISPKSKESSVAQCSMTISKIVMP